MSSSSSKGQASSKSKARSSRAHDPQPGPAVKTKSAVASEAPPSTRSDRRQELMRQRREERLKYAEKHKRQQLLTRIGLAVGALVLVAAIGYGIYDWAQSRPSDAPDGTIDYSYAGGNHTDEDVQYAENPPVGGEHDAAWQNCGFYSAPVRDENAVHALEHGAIWITYSPDLPQDQIDQLESLAEGTGYILVSPRAGLPSPVVASAWNHQVMLDSADDERLDEFVSAFRRSRNAPEPNGTCSGGTSATE